jgi:ribonuclease HII
LFPEENVFQQDPFFYEGVARDAGYAPVAGVDEVGRGPLAGPVVAAAVILEAGKTLPGVSDSKQMTHGAREEAFERIQQESLAVGVGVVSHRYIDRFNILNASLEAMRRAVLALDPQPLLLLIDGLYGVSLNIVQKCLVKGDQRSKSISAASVVAKVYRDRIMQSYHLMYPNYAFAQNKGYATLEHISALEKYGSCPIHRQTFGGFATLSKDRLRLGRLGEELALKTVKRLGYKDIVRNYRCPLGEVDLVARDGDTLVFVEIKTRRGKSIACAKEAVDGRKQRQLSKVALAFMKAHDCSDAKARFDVVAINVGGKRPEIEVIRNAFDLAY